MLRPFGNNQPDRPAPRGIVLKLSPKNWHEHQHYKTRNPPWVKLHKKLLDDKEFLRLPVASRALAPLLWLLASETVDGVFDASLDALCFRLRMSEKECKESLKPLIDKGFFYVASDVLAECKQLATTETEKRREETEQTSPQPAVADTRFALFWMSYPKRVGRGAAEKSFTKLNPDAALMKTILETIKQQKATDQWQRENGKFVPNPATWLNQKRWLDELAQGVTTYGIKEL